MKIHFALALLLAITCSLVNTGELQAQCGAQAGGYGCGYGAYDVGRLYRVLANNVPYYAAFPPVYYSAPVPRTYGHSPFAYPPGVRTPELENVAAQEILNPYVPTSTKDSSKSGDKVTQSSESREPLTILNPYATTRLAKNVEL